MTASSSNSADTYQAVTEAAGRGPDAMGRAATILREVAAHDRHIDPMRAAVGSSLAALVDAVGRH